MANVPFTSNYSDLSSQRGFQFKFFCQKCGNGYLSSFQTNSLGMAGAAMDAAASLLGGIFGRAAQTADQLQAMAAGPQHDAALNAAVAEISPTFKQCTRCGQWVCEPICWNGEAGLCEACAPDLDEEIAAAQAQASHSPAFPFQQIGSQTHWPHRVHCLKVGEISLTAASRAASCCGPAAIACS